MSFPNIPDINPHINIKFEDAINLLLTSIAMEEVSLSKLMDAETNKILCVLNNCMHADCCKHNDCRHDDCNHNDSVLNDAIGINKSVDGTIKDMIKLQMLLQFKLDSIKEILPCTSSTTTTSTSTSTTTTCTTSTCSTTTKIGCNCCLSGNGKGCVPNCCDAFNNCKAVLYAFVYSRDNVKNRTIRYTVGNDDISLRMHASKYNVKIQRPDQCANKLVIYGKGSAEKHLQCNPDISSGVEFILTVCKKVPDNLEYRMEIKSKACPELNHDSGFVQVKSEISNLRFFCC